MLTNLKNSNNIIVLFQEKKYMELLKLLINSDKNVKY